MSGYLSSPAHGPGGDPDKTCPISIEAAQENKLRSTCGADSDKARSTLSAEEEGKAYIQSAEARQRLKEAAARDPFAWYKKWIRPWIRMPLFMAFVSTRVTDSRVRSL